jgi:hypothetical protein
MTYGTLFRMRLRAGVSEEWLRAHFERWQAALGPRFPGTALDTLLRVDGAEREYIALHLFASRAAYGAMDGDALQDGWYRDLVAMLEAEPQFTDVEQLWQAG